jgi:hypothetical protein
MSNLLLFADEAGCLTFNRSPNVSRYFILCSVIMKDDGLMIDLMRLRRRLAWQHEPIGEFFHAAPDRQSVRDQVFGVLGQHDFTVQATILEKSKAHSGIRATEEKFYRYCWYRHFDDALGGQLREGSSSLLSSAAIGTRRQRAVFRAALDDAAAKHLPPNSWRTNIVPAANDPGIQVADYCAWAIQRKWESSNCSDTRSYDLIRDRITHESDVWREQSRHYY